MKSEELHQPSSPLHHHRRRGHHKLFFAADLKTLKKPKVFISMLTIIFLTVGFINHVTRANKDGSGVGAADFSVKRALELIPRPNCEKLEAPTIEKRRDSPQPNKDLFYHNRFEPRCNNDSVPSTQIRQTIIDRIFSGTSPWENFPPAYVSPLIHRKRAYGWGSNATVFETLIRRVRPKTIIEVGTFLGASATHMARLTRELGLDTQILCIDDFRGWAGAQDEDKSFKMVNGDSMLLYQFMQNVVTANATGSIIFLPFATTGALRGLCEWGVYGDLVEVDADHDFHSAWVDINNAYKVLRPGGVIFGHDYYWRGVGHAVHMFAELHGLRVGVDVEHWFLY